MSKMQDIGVLFTDTPGSEKYHILKKETDNRGSVIRNVLETDRFVSTEKYRGLVKTMRYLEIDRLWVHPGNDLSRFVIKLDFKDLPSWFVNAQDKTESPTGVSVRDRVVGDSREIDRYIFFPAQMSLTRNHKPGTPDWNLPDPHTLRNTVAYLSMVTKTPFLWSPAYSSKALLRRIHDRPRVPKIKPFGGGVLWDEASKNLVVRPSWSVRGRDGKQGLSDAQLQYKYIHGLDKNMQYLGACRNLRLPVKGYVSVDGSLFNENLQGFWEYEIQGVKDSMFNSYECYCPLKIKDTWTSTSLLKVAIASGMKLKIKRGLVFPKECIGGTLLDEWAKTIWSGRKMLEDTRRFPDRIAAHNAHETLKKFYIDPIGQFCREYSQEYNHPEWNGLIVQEAIARQVWTLQVRREQIEGKVILVFNDAFYLLSNERDIQKAYPDLVQYSQELRGYKHLGVAPMTDEIKEAFQAKRVADIETLIRKGMVKE